MNNKFDNMNKQEIYDLGMKHGLCIGLEVLEAFDILTPEMMEIVLNKVKTAGESFSDIKDTYKKYKDKRKDID